jgi:hypothetical protein
MRHIPEVVPSLGVDLDSSLLGGIPVGGRPEIYGKVGNEKQVSWEGSGDFVFAFRVRRVKVSRDGEVRSDEDYTKGANFGVAKETANEPPLRFVVHDDLGVSEEWGMEQGWRSETLWMGIRLLNAFARGTRMKTNEGSP